MDSFKNSQEGSKSELQTDGNEADGKYNTEDDKTNDPQEGIHYLISFQLIASTLKLCCVLTKFIKMLLFPNHNLHRKNYLPRFATFCTSILHYYKPSILANFYE